MEKKVFYFVVDKRYIMKIDYYKYFSTKQNLQNSILKLWCFYNFKYFIREKIFVEMICKIYISANNRICLIIVRILWDCGNPVIGYIEADTCTFIGVLFSVWYSVFSIFHEQLLNLICSLKTDHIILIITFISTFLYKTCNFINYVQIIKK